MAPSHDDGSSSDDNDKETKRGVTLLKKVSKARKAGIRFSVTYYNSLFILILVSTYILTISFHLGWVE
jgi:hypothetical protein